MKMLNLCEAMLRWFSPNCSLMCGEAATAKWREMRNYWPSKTKPDLLKNLYRGLTEAGIVVSCAASAESTEKAVAEQRFDIIVPCLRIPGKSGFDDPRQLRATGNRTYFVFDVDGAKLACRLRHWTGQRH
jgi:hypothetical protein